ncbi:MAG TPA: hypothetical protein VGD77_12370 [Gemmatimonadaceae bacterium]
MNLLRATAYRAYTRARGIHAAGELRAIEAMQRTTSFAEARARAVRAMLVHCRDHVPWYRDRLPAGAIDEGNAESLLRALPLLDKDTIRAHGDALVSGDVARRRTFRNTSGGSTGVPVELVQDQQFADRSRASTLWAWRRMGYEVGDRQYRLWGDEREILGSEAGSRRALRAWLYNTYVLNAFSLTPAQMAAHAARMAARPARLVSAYAQAAYEMARFLEEAGRVLPSQHAVTTSAGTLYPFMREQVARAFAAPVYNYYGSREVGFIASELPGIEGMWIPPWAQVVEVVDDAGAPVAAGTEGEIVVSLLLNEAMPLLRYRIGDRGSLLPDDGSGAQRLAHVAGRVVDVFRRAGGGVVDGEYFTHLLYHKPWVERFQFVQVALDRIELRVVLRDGPAPPGAEERAALQAAVHAAMGPDCHLDVEVVDAIPPLPSGKHRYTVRAIP